MDDSDKGCVLLADRHSPLSDGMRGLLETSFDVVVMVADEVSLLEGLSRLKVTLAVVDLAVTRGEGVQMVTRLRRQFPELKLIVTSVHDDAIITDRVLKAGADAFVLKRTIATDLLRAVDAVLSGQRFSSRPALGRR
jgi:DNA-binding NarL/FixJ family response regulator